tara:strand:+ start:34 stop:219 length:186 start_codon:yes stop_codon:yes gene_type:complete
MAKALHYSGSLLKGLYKGWLDSQQRSANLKIARHMLNTGSSDWRGHTIDSLALELNKRMGL